VRLRAAGRDCGQIGVDRAQVAAGHLAVDRPRHHLEELALGHFPGAQQLDELVALEAGRQAVRVGRDVFRDDRAELYAAAEVAFGVDPLGLAQERVATFDVGRRCVAVVAAALEPVAECSGNAG
jgi:hypothetical protein